MTDFLTTIEQDAAAALAEVKSGLTYLESEGQAIITWVEKEVPGAAGAMATFLQAAEADVAELAKVASSGLSAEVSALTDDLGTTLLNFIQASGMASNAKAGLAAIDVSAVNLIKTVGQSAVSAALAKVLASLATAAVTAAL